MTDAVPWAPRLPDDWEAVRADQMVRRVRRPPRSTDGIVTTFRDGQVTLRTNRRTEGFTEALQEIGYQGIRVGDLVVHGMDAFAGAIGVSDSDGKASPVVHAYRERKGDTRFVAYCLRVASRLGYIQALAKGIRERSTAFDSLTFKYLRLPAPPLREQRAIADFLDRETAKIDALIEKQGELVELLRERRVTVQEAAVVRGDWPSAPMYTTTTLIQTGPFGSQLGADEYVDDGVPVLNPVHLAGGSITPDAAISVSEETARRLSRHAVQSGDVIAARRGELGRCAVVTREHEGALCGTGSLIIRPARDYDPQFLQVVFSSRWNAEQLDQLSVGSTMPNLNAQMVGRLRLPKPTREIQDEILASLTKTLKRIDALIAKAEEFIALARERRAALITGAVTGQIDVTGEAS